MVNGQSAFLLAKEAGFDAQSIKDARHRRNELYQHYITHEDITISGVTEVLKALKEKYMMGIITSARHEDFELIHSKPYPDPYLEGMKKLGGTKEETIIIEDSERGLRSAVAAGIECAIVHNPFTINHNFSKVTHRLQTLKELEALLN